MVGSRIPANRLFTVVWWDRMAPAIVCGRHGGARVDRTRVFRLVEAEVGGGSHLPAVWHLRTGGRKVDVDSIGDIGKKGR